MPPAAGRLGGGVGIGCGVGEGERVADVFTEGLGLPCAVGWPHPASASNSATPSQRALTAALES